MRHFALLFHFLTFPASPAPAAFTAIPQHFNSGAGGDCVGIVGLSYFREVSDNPFALIYHLVKHSLFIGGDLIAVVVTIGNAWSEWIASQRIALFFEFNLQLIDFGDLGIEVLANSSEDGLGMFELVGGC